MTVQPKPAGGVVHRGRVTRPIRARPSGDAGATAEPTGSSPAATRASSGVPGRSRGGGDSLLLVFFGAALVMVVAIVLVGTVDQWWVLVPVMAVDLVVTFAVIAALVQMLGDDG